MPDVRAQGAHVRGGAAAALPRAEEGEMSDGCQAPEDTALVESLVGATITKAEWLDNCGGGEWTGHEFARLTLADGRVIEFGGYGYDSWGTSVVEVKPHEHRWKESGFFGLPGAGEILEKCPCGETRHVAWGAEEAE